MAYGRGRPRILSGRKGKKLRRHPFVSRGGYRL